MDDDRCGRDLAAADTIRDCIWFYEINGWDWILPVAFLADQIVRKRFNTNKCRVCGR